MVIWVNWMLWPFWSRHLQSPTDIMKEELLVVAVKIRVLTWMVPGVTNWWSLNGWWWRLIWVCFKFRRTYRWLNVLSEVSSMNPLLGSLVPFLGVNASVVNWQSCPPQSSKSFGRVTMAMISCFLMNSRATLSPSNSTRNKQDFWPTFCVSIAACLTFSRGLHSEILNITAWLKFWESFSGSDNGM